MRRTVAIIVLIIFPSSVMAQTSYPYSEIKVKSEFEKGVSEGESAAKKGYSPAPWVAAGFGGGIVLGLIGGGIVVGISQAGTVKPGNSQIEDIYGKSPEFKQGYLKGFSKRAKRKRLIGGIVGGLVGTATIVMIITHAGKR